MLQPPRIWWKPLDRLEKSWVTIAFVWCVFLTAMMPFWYYQGRQNVPTVTYQTTPDEFKAKVDAFTDEHKIGEEGGIPVVAPPADSDVYVLARQWQWYPILQLEKGKEYRIHLSSLDVLHGFSIQPVNLNFMALPGYDYVITLTPTQSGEFTIVCNEYCELGHHTMVGKIIVTE
ncbi:MAG: cytochrome c oxidase subunit II [Deltaproteobacteria bacterium]|nr:cytochrome c oxidase subunit II [Deltaproteobacteria bacterium]